MSTRMGFEGSILYGTAGSTAATVITNSRDIAYNLDPEKGTTTVRGASVDPPIVMERVTSLGITIEWTMLNIDTDSTLADLLTAAYAGNEVALRTLDRSAGKGFDGDVTVSVQHGAPIGGEQTFVFSATPSAESRAPVLYV